MSLTVEFHKSQKRVPMQQGIDFLFMCSIVGWNGVILKYNLWMKFIMNRSDYQHMSATVEFPILRQQNAVIRT